MVVAITFIIMFILFLLTVPVAPAIGVASSIGLIVADMQIGTIAQQLFAGLNSFTLLAIPFFVLAGCLMESSGISQRIVDAVGSFVCHKNGGYATVLIIACLFFGALSGSAPATVAAIGGILIPHMVKKGYDVSFSSATAAASAGLAAIIPPSILMILYCVGTSTSITGLFTAGFIPGIMIGVTLIIYAKYKCKKFGIPKEEKRTGKERVKALKDAIWALFMPIIILGGIYSGIFTATEASAIAVAYALFVGIVIYRTLTWKTLLKTFLEACYTIASIMLILSAAQLFAFILTYAKVPNTVANWFIGFIDNKYVYLLIINAFLLVVGMFFDPAPGMIILAPILAPVAQIFGIDLIQFGLIMVLNFSIGAMTPPFAVNLFVASQIGKIKYEQIVKPIMPYLAILIFDLILITYIPQISLVLPNLLK